jgi:hypothetical protein
VPDKATRTPIKGGHQGNTINNNNHMSLSPDERRTAALAFEWLDTYRALSRRLNEAPASMSVRPARAASSSSCGGGGDGTPYEIWATLTLFYVLHGFRKDVYPMLQAHEAVGTPPDFLARVQALLARLEAAAAAVGAPGDAPACYDDGDATPTSVGY